jgi:NAD-dependent DNA ligase
MQDQKEHHVEPDFEYTHHPEISFDNKSFCFTGKFEDRDRCELEAYVKSKGATYTCNVSKDTDYLVIGSQGTRCCSFSCCKRVVEKALELTKNGSALQYIKESDFLKKFTP